MTFHIPELSSLDIILITGASEVEHMRNLETVLQHLTDAGLHLKRSKCSFMVEKLQCLGYEVDETGFHPQKAKVDAIKEARAPTNMTELKSFLGLVNFYRRFFEKCSNHFNTAYRSAKKSCQISLGYRTSYSF